MVKQPGHLTSMKKERGPGTRVCQVCMLEVATQGGDLAVEGYVYTLSLCWRASC